MQGDDASLGVRLPDDEAYVHLARSLGYHLDVDVLAGADGEYGTRAVARVQYSRANDADEGAAVYHLDVSIFRKLLDSRVEAFDIVQRE